MERARCLCFRLPDPQRQQSLQLGAEVLWVKNNKMFNASCHSIGGTIEKGKAVRSFHPFFASPFCCEPFLPAALPVACVLLSLSIALFPLVNALTHTRVYSFVYACLFYSTDMEALSAQLVSHLASMQHLESGPILLENFDHGRLRSTGHHPIEVRCVYLDQLLGKYTSGRSLLGMSVRGDIGRKQTKYSTRRFLI